MQHIQTSYHGGKRAGHAAHTALLPWWEERRCGREGILPWYPGGYGVYTALYPGRLPCIPGSTTVIILHVSMPATVEQLASATVTGRGALRGEYPWVGGSSPLPGIIPVTLRMSFSPGSLLS